MAMKPVQKPVQLTLEQSRPSPIEEAYQHFRLDRQAMLVSRKTLLLYSRRSASSRAGCAWSIRR